MATGYEINFLPINPNFYKPSNKWIDALKKEIERRDKLYGKSAPVYYIDEAPEIHRNDALDAVTYYFYKGENKTMKAYEVEFNKKLEDAVHEYQEAVNAAKQKKDMAIAEAEKARDMAKMKEEKEAKAAELKAEYDAYIAQGFTPDQAMTFIL